VVAEPAETPKGRRAKKIPGIRKENRGFCGGFDKLNHRYPSTQTTVQVAQLSLSLPGFSKPKPAHLISN